MNAKVFFFAANIVGLHDPKSKRSEDWFIPHCGRYFFTAHLIISGMPRDYARALRGDKVRMEAIDNHNYITRRH
jgi:hypothetical protein